MTGESEDHGLSVFLVDPVIIARFKEWLERQNQHLSGPFRFNPDDPTDETWFVRPFRTPEEFDRYMRGEQP